MNTTVKLYQKFVLCDCGTKHLVRWTYKKPSTKCPKTHKYIYLITHEKQTAKGGHISCLCGWMCDYESQICCDIQYGQHLGAK